MKILSVLLSLLTFASVLADNTWSDVLNTATQTQDGNMQIELVVSSNEVWVSDTFELTIRIKQKWPSTIKQWMFNIEWFEPFDVVWDRTVSNTNIVNWEQASLIDKILNLRPKNEWVFVIGPVKISNKWKSIVSNSLEIKVWSKNFSAKSKNWDKTSSQENLIQDNPWINAWKIDYFKMIFSFEIFLFLIIIWFWLFLFKSRSEEKLNQKGDLNLIPDLPKENRLDFFDQCLKILHKSILKNSELKAISVNDWELGKIWGSYNKRKVIKEIINQIYTLKWIRECNMLMIKELRNKISKLVLK